MRRTIRITAAAAVLAGVGLSSAAVRAATVDGFHLIEQSVVVDKAAGTATFRLGFDREPRFFLPHGGGGDQPDAFQIEVDADSNTFQSPTVFDDIDAVIRGAEISAGDGIPIRARDGDGGSGGATGGWGPVRALVPFELNGATLTFTTALATLGDDDGRFRYRIVTIEEGGMTGEVNAAIIPLPAALWGGMILLGAAGVAVRARRRVR